MRITTGYSTHRLTSIMQNQATAESRRYMLRN